MNPIDAQRDYPPISIQCTKRLKGQNEQNGHVQPENNNIIYMANDKDKAIRDNAVLTPQAINPRIVKPEVQAINF